ncbi:hypothetical protein [Streptomyces mirabilis]|uniref:hypothetical protein n=1 Tax=Streptomyces mirabilis TaxID=68239 RepID=UPI0036D0BFF6
MGGFPAPAQRGHPWTGWSFSARWDTRETLNVTLVRPELVVEVGVDVTRDASGRWRHLARWHRARPDLSPGICPTHPLHLFFLLWGVVRGRRGDVGLPTTA